MLLKAARRTLSLDQPVLMGILNVTPDSFSDGGSYDSVDAAVQRALAMAEEGAAIIDIGGESTRPGATPVDADEELARVIPVIERLRAASNIFISIDTVKPDVMRAACAAGADMINDVMGLQAPGAIQAAADTGAAVCLMHMQGEPRTMQKAPHYDDVVAEVGTFLEQRAQACEAAGVESHAICLDPGFGFGKTLEHNLTLLRELDQLGGKQYPLLVGISRKSMFVKLFGDGSAQARLIGSTTAAAWAVAGGAHIIRTHDVQATGYAMRLAGAIGTRDQQQEVVGVG